MLRQRLNLHARRDRAVPVDNGPAVFRPGHRREERLAPQVMGHARGRTKAEEDRPPAAVVGLNEIGMARALNWTRFEIAVRQDRIAWISFEGTPGTSAARDRL